MIAAFGLFMTMVGLSPVTRPVQVHGRVVRIVAGDTMRVPGVRVVLHRVTAEKQGPIDSMVTDRAGQFRASVEADSGSVLLASSRWNGVAYFAQPVSPEDGSANFVIVVADTSSSAAVSLAARHVIIGAPSADGSRDVVDLVVIRNAGQLTRVAVDSIAATFWMVVPLNIIGLNIGDADFSRDAFGSRADTVTLHAPIPPGERQFMLTYQLPPGAVALRLPLAPVPDTLSLLTEESNLTVGGGLVSMGEEEVSGRSFHRYAAGGKSLTGGIVVSLPGDHSAPSWLLPVLIAVVVIGLGFGTVRVILPHHR